MSDESFSDPLLLSLINTAEEGVWFIDPNGKTLFISEHMAEMLGYTSKEILNTYVYDYYFPQDVNRNKNRIAANIAGEKHHHTSRFRKKDGKALLTVAKTSPLKNSDGHIYGALGLFTDITQQHYTEMALQESEQRFRTMADNTPALMWTAGPKLTRNYFNKSWETFTGLNLNQLSHDKWLKSVHPEDIPLCQNTYLKATQDHTSFEIEYRLLHHDQTYHWLLENGNPRFTSDGIYLGFSGSCVDITHRKQSEAYTAQLASIVETSDSVIYSLDFHHNVLSWNKGAQQLYEYTAQEMIGKPIWPIIPKNPDLIRHQRSLVKSLRQNPQPTTETQRQTKSGRLVDVSQTISLVMSPDGYQVGISVVDRDITLKKAIEREHDELLAQLNGLVEIAPIGIAFINSDLKFIKINDTFAEINGLPAAQHLHKTPLEIFAPSQAKIFTRQLESVLAYQATKNFEIVSHTSESDQKQYLSVICYPIAVSAQEIGVGMIVQDITEQKIIERRKDDFLSMASHELKTPLTTIKAFTQILQSSNQSDPKSAKKLLTKIDQQINRLTKLVNDLLDISKIRSGKIAITPEWFDFDLLLKDTLKSFSTTLNSHRISLSGKTKSKIFADKSRIAQVITNFLSNAVKYSPEHNQIDIEVEKRAKDIYVSVRDFGLGIAPANQKRIFQSFYRVFDANDRQFPGLGIGLYISSEIIRLHGGTIGVKSRLDAGSLFYFTLPYETKSSRHRRRS